MKSSASEPGLGRDAPSGVSKIDFIDSFESKNSAQIQNFMCWHCRQVNLLDCGVSLYRAEF